MAVVVALLIVAETVSPLGYTEPAAIFPESVTEVVPTVRNDEAVRLPNTGVAGVIVNDAGT